MKILFIHQNFPGQFLYLASTLARKGHEVKALCMSGQEVNGVERIIYQPNRGTSTNIHPWVADFESKVIRAEAVLYRSLLMKRSGYTPDVIVSHHGWGESLFIKEVWPKVPLGIYCEFFYHAHGADVGFDPEFYRADDGLAANISIKNTNNYLHFIFADAGISPTFWQRSTFPEPFRNRISVIHEGVDTNLCKPNPDVCLMLDGNIKVSKEDEIITFVNRNLEPQRGYHSFMRSLPAIQKARPHARIILVGGDGVSYGNKAPDGTTWKTLFLNEVADQLDLSRIHYLGNVDYQVYLALLQLATVHVYLTYPFVLSWSCIEAMSVGCAIVGSDTEPVREVITHNHNGVLVNMLSPSEISTQVIDLIENKNKRVNLGLAARQTALSKFDRDLVCLPRQIDWIEKLALNSS